MTALLPGCAPPPRSPATTSTHERAPAADYHAYLRWLLCASQRRLPSPSRVHEQQQLMAMVALVPPFSPCQPSRGSTGRYCPRTQSCREQYGCSVSAAAILPGRAPPCPRQPLILSVRAARTRPHGRPFCSSAAAILRSQAAAAFRTQDDLASFSQWYCTGGPPPVLPSPSAVPWPRMRKRGQAPTPASPSAAEVRRSR